ncbi:recombinase family protein [Methylobacterium sp. NMS14P]|uniref:recombinase family protein n=1 Tax=Methylobacterium sp. NMS14P TaxID=2894310 RepID=UPI002359ACAC|nr:recombinase family protein [Methylobacterium sp. NMS14P]WCS25230.1 recombinase family protein [Methylobacterium sp. NMS14P]
MAQGKLVSYLRVSTEMQGRSGLGLEAQRQSVANFLNGGQWNVLAELVEVESGSRDDRPELRKALALCRLHNATLVIAKLDRLSRDAHFLLGLQKAGVRFVAADMPEANEMVVGIMAVVAQAERQMIAKRTREALAAKRSYYATLSNADRAALQAAGKATSLGNPTNLGKRDEGRALGRARRTEIANGRAADLAPIIADVKAAGAVSLREIAAALNRRAIPAPRGGAWSAVQVQRATLRISVSPV